MARTGQRSEPRAEIVGAIALVVTLAGLATGCGPRLDVGSELLWTARFEGNNFDEWTTTPGGGANASPTPPNSVAVSNEHAHRGQYAAKLVVDAPAGGGQQNTGLIRRGGLPVEGFYSAWYYLPRSVTVGTFWVISKLRIRTVVDDPNSANELYDVDLVNLPSGEMTMVLYDHRTGMMVPLDVATPVVPVGVWFQIELFYRNANDATGQLTLWLDGKQIIDIKGHPMAPTPYVEWDTVSVGEDLNPSQETLFVDDCAVSRARVGPTGALED